MVLLSEKSLGRQEAARPRWRVTTPQWHNVLICHIRRTREEREEICRGCEKDRRLVESHVRSKRQDRGGQRCSIRYRTGHCWFVPTGRQCRSAGDGGSHEFDTRAPSSKESARAGEPSFQSAHRNRCRHRHGCGETARTRRRSNGHTQYPTRSRRAVVVILGSFWSSCPFFRPSVCCRIIYQSHFPR